MGQLPSGFGFTSTFNGRIQPKTPTQHPMPERQALDFIDYSHSAGQANDKGARMQEHDEADQDPLAVAFDAAMDGPCNAQEFVDMVKVAVAYREKAAYFEGKCAGYDNATILLRRLASVLDPHRPSPDAIRLGMMLARMMDDVNEEDEEEAEQEAPMAAT